MMSAKPRCQKIVDVIPCWSSCLCWIVFMMTTCCAEMAFGSDTILQGQQLRDGEILSSASNTFRLRFFSLGSSGHRYLGMGIFRNGQGKPVWIGNRNNPIDDASGALMINDTDGMLHVVYSRGIVSLPTTASTAYRNINTSATLRDDGNLVLSRVYPNGSVNRTLLWQSFDYPTDVLLPGMRLGLDLKAGHQWFLTSWIGDQSPPSGPFTLGVDRNSTNQLIISWHEKAFWTSRPWQKDPFGNLVPHADSRIVFEYNSNEAEKYFKYSPKTEGKNTALHLTSDGKIVVIPIGHELVHCDLSSTVPQSGCVHHSLRKCTTGDNSFSATTQRYGSVSPSSIQEYNNNLNIVDCQANCMQNCSCHAYASLTANGTGCEYWDRDNFRIVPQFGNSTRERFIYVRRTSAARAMKRWRMWLISSVGAMLLLLINIVFIRRNQREKAKRKEAERLGHHELVDTTTPPGEHTMANETSKMGQVHLFRFENIEMATNKFSTENKLGEGGFGQVYKGKLLDGQSVAVKRLSRSSNQGVVQFKNEIQLIAKLQHNNLVRLLGCCIHREDMMLVYEYMPNKSLDYFFFDPTKRALLQWTNRMNIIEGISQGLEYLHKHSRLRVIHRDIKANNILLDQNMTPKISDFGIARISGAQDSRANTKTIVGTYGYMSPEYAINGVVSTKLDVFSFGVLILEIVSGKKNQKCYHSERSLNLVGLAWELWIEGREQDLVDATMNVSNHLNEVQRCIYVGLLCVQDNAANRPSMTDVILLLKNESLPLPIPKQPGFFIHVCTVDKDKEERLHKNCSNNLSTSVLEPR